MHQRNWRSFLTGMNVRFSDTFCFFTSCIHFRECGPAAAWRYLDSMTTHHAEHAMKAEQGIRE